MAPRTRGKDTKPTDKQLGDWADRLHDVAATLESASLQPGLETQLAQQRTSLAAQLSAVELEIREAI